MYTRQIVITWVSVPRDPARECGDEDTLGGFNITVAQDGTIAYLVANWVNYDGADVGAPIPITTDAWNTVIVGFMIEGDGTNHQQIWWNGVTDGPGSGSGIAAMPDGFALGLRLGDPDSVAVYFDKFIWLPVAP